jgi:hypothetical protein
MCPACLASIGAVSAAAATSGGLAVLAAAAVRSLTTAARPQPAGEKKNGTEDRVAR